ncbi:MAG: SDR family oxidoreductase [Chloroflexi bacterium]|nr:SDR family oxidoreductase [Chloroflexota bacterium]
MNLHNSTILITGGGSGLGAATARLLTTAGAYTIVIFSSLQRPITQHA